LETEPQRTLLRELVTSSRGRVEDGGAWRLFPFLPMIPDLFALPLKGFSIFLMLFAVLIGPVNFILVKRTKRPALLLFSIPAIAIVAAVLLFLYGVASQGLGVKIASESFTVLDQREHRASSAEVRMIFAGLSPGAGLLPRPGTSCYAIGTLQIDEEIAPIRESSRAFRVDQTDGFVLTGQFIPARTAFLQQILSEHAERARLGVRKKGAAFQVENGLGARIDQLLLRDASGNYYRLAGVLESGGSAELESVGEPDATTLETDLAGVLQYDGLDALAPGAYLAQLDRNPFGDECGVTGRPVGGAHHVLGVLALDAEEWR
ncbi:MAG TPA: hypothetical protein VM509_05925, partial [Planctomycetota bacterium]|nr:hypothetical protein [Planctomycetota bacterium]